MKMNKFSLGLIAVLTAGMMAVPVFAAQTGAGGTTQEAAAAEETAAAAEEAEAEQDFLNPGRAWEVETDMEDQVYTIRIKARGSEKEGYHWENFNGDRGDATVIELLTQSTRKRKALPMQAVSVSRLIRRPALKIISVLSIPTGFLLMSIWTLTC